MEKHPGSDLAVRLISANPVVGGVSLQQVEEFAEEKGRVTVERHVHEGHAWIHQVTSFAVLPCGDPDFGLHSSRHVLASSGRGKTVRSSTARRAHSGARLE